MSYSVDSATSTVLIYKLSWLLTQGWRAHAQMTVKYWCFTVNFSQRAQLFSHSLVKRQQIKNLPF